MPGWRNWAGNQACRPAEVARPATEAELAEVVGGAAARGLRVKVVGSGHSFTPAALTDGVLVRLERLDRLLHVDRDRRLVTVQAGMTLHRLNRVLAALGFALENLGDIETQTVSGAISTGTHGTGIRLGGLATQVAGLEIVTASGEVVRCSPDDEPEVFRCARVGVGALGAVSAVTLRVVPAFDLHAAERPERIDGLLPRIDGEVEGNDHFELYWVPHTGWALTKRNNRTDRPRGGRSRWGEVRDDLLLANVAFGLACRVGRRLPSQIPRLVRAIPATGPVDFVDRSDRVFTSPRHVRFYEMEYGVPREHGVEAIERVRRVVAGLGMNISFPVEMRFTAADDIPLSMGFGRESCYVAVHVYRGTPGYERYFRAVEDELAPLGGRPHWGKLHWRTAADLRPAYPEWDAFAAVRDRLDPDRTFANAYTDRVLG